MTRTLVFEIGTEEIPAKFMSDILEQLKQAGENKLNENRIKYTKIKALGTPRRLVLIAEGVDERQEELNQFVKGPAKMIAYDAQGNFTNAALGFMRSQGIAGNEIVIKEFGGSEYIYAKKFKIGEETIRVLKRILPEIILSLNFKKSMRWRDYNIKFVRPIRWLVALFGNEKVEFEIEGAKSSNITYGHRTLYNKEIKIKSADEYIDKMDTGHIIVDPNERKELIIRQVEKLAKSVKGTPLIDEELLEEVVFLVEYPTALMGKFETEFLALIKEVIITPMKEHQRYFPVLDDKGNLLPYFITIRNGGTKNLDIVQHGNERVLRARLKDAQFFYKEDMREKLEKKVEKLKKVVYQEKLGTIYEKVERITGNAVFIGKKLGFSKEMINNLERAAKLCKADLETAMVSEFDELQGVMGREYALKNGEKPEVAEALFSHYLPRFSGDELPKDIIGQIISVSDKIDSITGSFGIGVQPTGSQDPYGLRRQAIGVISILSVTETDINLNEIIQNAIGMLKKKITENKDKLKNDIEAFFKQRLRVILIDKGYRYDIVDAVLEQGLGSIKDIIKKVNDISDIRQEDNENFEKLISALNRVSNITAKAAELNKDVDQRLFENNSEKELFKSLGKIFKEVYEEVKVKEYINAIKVMYNLIDPINDFFDNTMIIVEDEKIKNNRLSLLKSISGISDMICDFTKIS